MTRGTTSRQVLLFALLAFALIPSGAIKFPWKPNPSGRFVDTGPCWPVRLIQLQLTLLYGVNAIAKSSGTYLLGEVLVDMSVSLQNFQVDMSSGTIGSDRYTSGACGRSEYLERVSARSWVLVETVEVVRCIFRSHVSSVPNSCS